MQIIENSDIIKTWCVHDHHGQGLSRENDPYYCMPNKFNHSL